MPDSMTRTTIAEVAPGIHRVSSYHEPWRSSINSFLLAGSEPMLISTGLRRHVDETWKAIAQVVDPTTLRWIVVLHFEADECGALNEWLAAAPQSTPVCGRIAAMVSVDDVADRAPRALADGELLELGRHAVRWVDTPHIPHGWDCGLMMEERTRTFLCGDLFTQGGAGDVALTESDILGPSEAFRAPLDYFAHAPESAATLRRLAELQPTTLACMHGSAYRGDGGALLRALAERLA
jgi:flavorubredoxin